jgi:hypothetical protein
MIKKVRSRGRCPSCMRKHQLTSTGVMHNHKNPLREQCPGGGAQPINPTTDTTMDYRDKQSYWHAIRELNHIAGKSFLTDKDKANVVRLRGIRDSSLAGTHRVSTRKSS